MDTLQKEGGARFKDKTKGAEMESANDAVKGEPRERLRAVSKASKVKIKNLESEFNKTLEETKKEEAQKWIDLLDNVRKDHKRQMAAMQSQFEAMSISQAQARKDMQTISEKLSEVEQTRLPPKDPSKVTLHCRDCAGRTVSVAILKTSPLRPLFDAYCEKLTNMQRSKQRSTSRGSTITVHCLDQNNMRVSVTIGRQSRIEPLMLAYCGMSGIPIHQVRFFFDMNIVLPGNTPDSIGLEDDDIIEASYWVEGGD